jgi:hypothetical protein
MTGSTNPQVIVTKHAVRRAQQRGVVLDAIYGTAICGDPKRAVGGVIRRTLSRTAMKKLAVLGFSTSEICRCQGTVLITRDTSSEERVVITVRPTEKNGKKRGSQHKPKHVSHKTRPLSIGVAEFRSLDGGSHQYWIEL